MRRALLAALVLVLVAVAAYALFPYAVSSSISSLKPGSTVYVYGRVTSQRLALANLSVFQLSSGSDTIYVEWNGGLPATGTMVLVHGRVGEFFGVKYIEADSVIVWPF